ncbi:MAG: hypothetical protein HUJ99_02485, partial [Bacteroidaceae bacterium]|nr:hypothetical protein [Bacteroidaceae bacterium]
MIFLVLSVLGQMLCAQDKTKKEKETIPSFRTKGTSGYLGYRIEQGDTVYFDSINPVWVFPRGCRAALKVKTI